MSRTPTSRPPQASALTSTRRLSSAVYLMLVYLPIVHLYDHLLTYSQLFAGRPSLKKLQLWDDNGVFQDPITKAEGRKQYEPQWVSPTLNLLLYSQLMVILHSMVSKPRSRKLSVSTMRSQMLATQSRWTSRLATSSRVSEKSRPFQAKSKSTSTSPPAKSPRFRTSGMGSFQIALSLT